jgi:mannitol/fructose-specific phosphotransferase system IIA component (Ntr-type)
MSQGVATPITLPHPRSEKVKRYSSSVTGLEWPRGFQEVKVPRFHDNGT